MSKVEVLKELVSQRLSAAAEEIFSLLKTTVAEYEEELCRFKLENQRQRRLLDSVLLPEVRLHRADAEHDPDPSHSKDEQKRRWSSHKRKQCQGAQTEDNREVKSPASSSEQQVGTEGDGQGCEEPDSDSTKDSNQHGTETRKPPADLKSVKSNGVARGVKKHKRGKKSLRCCKCDKTFDPRDSGHMRSASGKKSFICSVCVPTSTQSSHLISVRRGHSGEKTFMCVICKKQCNHKGDAVRHIRTHTGEKPFSCSVCGKRFTQSTGLGIHMRTHTGERPFRCSHCPKRFVQSGILARHMRIHTGEKPYRCSECDTSFSLSQSLLKHIRTHTGERPFTCSVCDKRFTQKGHLTQHMMHHTGERSFSCHVCGRKFTRQSTVKKHKCVPKNSE